MNEYIADVYIKARDEKTAHQILAHLANYCEDQGITFTYDDPSEVK